MEYRSTRGGTSGKGFADVLIEGLAPDGGLYIPHHLPPLPTPSPDYAEATADFIAPFVTPDPLADEIHEMAVAVYDRFRHPEVAPLRPMGGGRFLLELFWGPTLSFKDYALQLVGAMFDSVLARRGDRLVILGATSGDTGSAAIEGCRGRPGIEIIILFPRRGMSEVQRRQMTTVKDANVHAVAVDGSFDDCQRLVKAAFAQFRSSYPLGAINSINWARIVAQAAYYAHTAGRLDGWPAFVVPTGNFGNVLSAHIARRMGAEVGELMVANNANHGLADLIESGTLEVASVQPTTAPAMDIQVPSNLERYLFEISNGNPARVRALQHELADTGRLALTADETYRLQRDFSAAWVDDSRIIDTIRRVHEDTGVTLDPHTALAWEAAGSIEGPAVVVSTAHPAKFPDVIARAVGMVPDIPEPMAGMATEPERVIEMEPDLGALEDVLAMTGV